MLVLRSSAGIAREESWRVENPCTRCASEFLEAFCYSIDLDLDVQLANLYGRFTTDLRKFFGVRSCVCLSI